MNIMKKLIATTGLLFLTSMAQATVINFAAMANSNPGESGWSTLNLNLGGVNLAITGHATTDNDPNQFAYLDSRTGGLGVCKDLNSAANTPHPNSTRNVCSNASDDNVTTGEYLSFVFDKAVTINNLWFNNNHDGGFNSSSTVNINGLNHHVSTGYAGGANGIGSFNVAANTEFKVGYSNTQFYVDGMEVSAQVPEPSTIALFGMGIIALGFARRAKKS